MLTARGVFAQAFLGAPYLTPEHPTPSDPIVVNVVGDGCEILDSGVIPHPITQVGNALTVVFTGGFWTDPLDCFHGVGAQPYSIGTYSPSTYTLNIFWRYPGIGGDIEFQDLGTLSFTVSAAPQEIAELPMLSLGGLAALALVVALLGGVSSRRDDALSKTKSRRPSKPSTGSL